MYAMHIGSQSDRACLHLRRCLFPHISAHVDVIYEIRNMNVNRSSIRRHINSERRINCISSTRLAHDWRLTIDD